MLIKGLKLNVIAYNNFNVMLLTKQIAASKIVEKKKFVCDCIVILYWRARMTLCELSTC